MSSPTETFRVIVKRGNEKRIADVPFTGVSIDDALARAVEAIAATKPAPVAKKPKAEKPTAPTE